MAWGPGRFAWKHKAVVSSWRGGQGLRLPLRRIGIFSEAQLIPADASGAYRPNPQAKTKFVSHHP